MRLIHKELQSIELDFAWLRFDRLPLLQRLDYLLRKYYALATRATAIAWLGSKFTYDNLRMPATLQSYPRELVPLLKHLKTQTPLILDIGANVGQFASTMAFLLPQARIFSFEPNPMAFELLMRNMRPHRHVTCFKYSVSTENNLPFFLCARLERQGKLHREKRQRQLARPASTANTG
jgi:hypothetical protein